MKTLRKGLSILLCLCLVVTTVYGCFTFEALAEDDDGNLWSYGTNENVPASFTSGISGQINTYGFFANTVASGVVDITVDSGGYNSGNALHFKSTYTGNSVGRIIGIEQGKTYKISFKYKGDGKSYPFLILNLAERVRPGVSGKNVSVSCSYSEIERKDSWNFPNCGDTWNTYEKTFTASTGDYLAVLWATSSNSAASQTNLYMDDISVVEVVDINFKQNVNGHYVYDNFGDAGTVSATAAANNQVTLKAVPKSGYSFMGWYYGDTKISSTATTTIGYVAGRTYIANFRTTQDVNFWADGDMETILDSYSYLGSNIVNGENADGWVGYRLGGNNQYTRAKAVDTEKHTGSYSLYLDLWGEMRVIGRRLKLQPGRTYRFTYWRNGSVDTFGIYNHNDPDLEIVCSDAQYGLEDMNSASGVTTLVSNRTGADGWTQFTYEFTTEAGKPYVDILWSRNSKTECYIDDISLVQVGHYWGALHSAVAETCTTDGSIAYYQCVDCGVYANTAQTVISSSEITISATGHNPVYCAVKAATCVDKGYSQACYYCRNCKKYYSDEACTTQLNTASVEIAPTGVHTISYVSAKAATCTANGNTAHYECSVCGQGFTNSSGTSTLAQNSWVTPKTAHQYGSIVEEVEPTCGTNGVKAHYVCSSCGGYFDSYKNEVTEDELTIPATGHTFGARIDGTPATCDHAGQISYYVCSECGGYFDENKNAVTAEQLVIAQLSHEYGTIVPQQDPTCTTEGLARHYHCVNCGKYFDENHVETTVTALTLAPLGHVAVHVPYNKPKTSSDGWLEHWYCQRCDSYFINSSLSKKVSRSEVWLPHTATQEGTTGACSWTLTNGILTISGSGAMANYSSYNIDRPWGVQITKVIIESGVTSVGNYAFKGCTRLAEVQIANSVTRIGAGAFNGTAIETLSIGSGVTYIGSGAFENIGTLTSITVAAGNTVYSASGNCLIETATRTLIRGANNSTIPTGGTVTAIGERAFSGCATLTSITIPTAVTYIGTEVFMGCTALTSVALGTGVKTISAYAFAGCTALTTVSGGSNVTYIGTKAFDETAWLDAQTGTNGVVYLGKVAYIYIGGSQAVSLSSGTVSISPYAFKDSAVTSVTLPSGFLRTGDNAFENCTALTSVNTSSSSLAGIGVWAFKGCSALSSITLPATLTSIGYGAFKGAGLTAIVIPANVIYIEGETFAGCTKLETVDIKSDLIGIGAEAFANCTKLTDIVLPDTLTSIGYGAFDGCTNLSNVYYAGWQDDAAEIVIDAGNESLTAIDWTYGYEPEVVSASGTTGSVSYSVSGTTLTISGSGAMANYTYDSKLPWGTAITSVVVNSGVTKIGDYAFKNCKEITSVSLPSTVTTVGELAFFGCENLSSISTSNIATYNYGSFKGCSSITSVTIKSGVTSIPSTCFSGCSSLATLTFSGTTVTTIGTSAFEGCASLVTVSIPSNVTTISKKAFYGCTSLKNLTLNSNLTTIESMAFGKCSSITTLTVPTSVTTIDEGAFFGCSGLTSISIPFVGRQRVTYSDANKYTFGYIFGKQPYDGGEAVEQNHVTVATDAWTTSSTVTHKNRTSYTYSTTYYDYDNNGGAGVSKRKDDQLSVYYIPRSLAKVTVTDSSFIPSYSFENCNMIGSATISSAVTTMGHSAFKSCKGLYSVTFSNSSTSTMGKETFVYCSNLRYVSIPIADTAITNLEYRLFYDCYSLVSFTAPQGIQYIENEAFYACSGLQTLHLYSNVKAIDTDAFDGCDSIKDIYTKSSKPSALLGRKHNITVSGSESPFDDDSITWHYGSNPYYDNYGITGNCTWKITNNSVLTISGTGPMGNYALGENMPWVKALTSVIIEEGVTSIGSYAFQGNDSITSITIPSTVRTIGEGAFYGCKKIASLSLPSKLYSIGRYAFSGCTGLTSFTFPSGITSVPAGLFSGCTALTSVTMNNGLTSIENGAFLGCNHLTSVKIPSTVTSIEGYAFANCSALTSITMDNHVDYIGYGAFASSGLTNVTYGGSQAQRNAIEIEDGNAKLENATWAYLTKNGTTGACTWTLSNGVLTISGSGSTENFTIDSELPWGHDITKVVIGSGVTNISGNGYAFRNCPNLTSFEVQSGNSYFSVSGNCLIRSADNHKNIVAGCKTSVIPTSSSTADVIKAGAFCCVPGLTSIHIPANIISIDKRAFIGCSNVQTITATNNGTYRTNGKVIYNTSGKVVFGSAYSPNLFANGDADSITTDDLTTANGWYRTVANGQGGIVGLNISSEESYSGSKSYEISYLYGHGAYRTLQLTAGKTYTLSFWHKSPVGGNCQYFQIINRASSTASNVAMNGSAADANHVQLVSKQWQFSAGEWTKESYTFTLGAGMDTIDIVFTQSGSSDKPIYFDDFKLVANDDFDGFTATEIYDGAFAYNTSLDSLYIPATVTAIGGTDNEAFVGSPNFSGVLVADGNSNYHSSGNTLIKDDTTDTIIAGTNTSNYAEAATTTAIAKNAFNGRAQLKSINISKYITSIGESAFAGCGALETVYYGGNPSSRGSINIEPYNLPLTSAKWLSTYSGTTGSCTWTASGTTLTITGSGAMADYTAGSAPWPKEITKVVISSGVTKVGNYAFYEMPNLAEVEIAGSVTTIGTYAFARNEQLESVDIASGLVTVSEGAFSDCDALTKITLPSSVTTIGTRAFYGDEALETLDTGTAITSIGSYAFADTGIRSAVVPASVTTISDYAYSSCENLVNVIIQNGVTTIGKGAFSYDSALAKIEIPASVTAINDNAFDGCSSMKSFHMGKNVATLGNEVLKNTRDLESIKVDPLNSTYKSVANTIVKRSNSTILYGCKGSVVASGITGIASGAFYGSGLTDLYLASSVTSIAYNAFADSGVVRVSYQGSQANRDTITMGTNNALLKDNVVWTYNCTNGTSGDIQWYYIGTKLFLIGSGSMADYTGSNSAPWRYTYDSELGHNVDTVITDVYFDEGITNIGAYAFNGCTTLKNIDLPASIEDIGNRAFYGCSGLEHITMEEGNDKYYAQGDCLIEIDEENGNKVILGTRNSVIPEDDDVVYIASGAFRNNTELRTIEIPANICGIESEAFRGCTSLAEITFTHNSSFESIDHAAFYGCTAIDTVYFIGSSSNMNKLKNKIQTDNESLEDADWQAVTACDIHGHVYDATYQEVPATCTTNGTIAYQHCSVCNKYYDMNGNLANTAASRRINATGHEHVHYPALDATHTTVGHQEYYFCPGCGTYYDSELVETTWEALLTPVIGYVYGDVDNSGTVDLYDAILLRQYVAYYNPSTGTSTVTVYGGADANADGKVDLMDVVLIRQYLTYYDDETGTSTINLGPLA